jgi:sulfite exporter TauE/SafE
MPLSVIISGFVLGAAGSLHCVGMCGPLSLVLPVHHLSAAKKTVALLLYQFGRIITYSVIGLIFGFAGRRVYLAGYQQWFSITMGIIILLSALTYFIQKRYTRLSLLNKFYEYVQRCIVRILKSAKGLFSFLLLGMANGLLPCGMVYIALAAILSFNQVWQSVSFMAMFGAGTLPAMMLVAYAGQQVKPQTRTILRKAIPYFVTAIGFILILRGLNLGIPFISPALPDAPGHAVVCH